MNKIRNKKSYFNILLSIFQFVTHYYSENYKKRHLMGFFDWLKKYSLDFSSFSHQYRNMTKKHF